MNRAVWRCIGRALLAVGLCTMLPAPLMAGSGHTPSAAYRGLLGKGSKKVRVEGNKTYLWAGGDIQPNSPDSQWYDYTGSPIPAAELQFGIGKDSISSIDDPLFVSPDDPRLLRRNAKSHYRPKEKVKTNDDIRVIGYVQAGEARAYPVALLDHHELVNDHIGGKPVTVGW